MCVSRKNDDNENVKFLGFVKDEYNHIITINLKIYVHVYNFFFIFKKIVLGLILKDHILPKKSCQNFIVLLTFREQNVFALTMIHNFFLKKHHAQCLYYV